MSVRDAKLTASQVTYQGPECQPFVVPPSWAKALDDAVVDSSTDGEVDLSRKVYLVQGVKKTGKSTFARTLANRLLAKFVMC